MDSSVSETYGNQEGSAYNGYFACTCYHPLFLFNQFGDLERVMLRRGNHPSAKFWRRVLLPVIERYRDRDIPKYFRRCSEVSAVRRPWSEPDGASQLFAGAWGHVVRAAWPAPGAPPHAPSSRRRRCPSAPRGRAGSLAPPPSAPPPATGRP